MNDKDIDQARKLSNTEMESQKGGATFASLNQFIVSANIRRPTFGGFNPQADTVMCIGQTRSAVLDPVVFDQQQIRTF